jgi:hypothetical protein
MAENKKGFVLYADLIHTVRKLSKENAGTLFLTILEYVNDENPVIENELIDVLFEGIKHQLKRDLKKYEARAERSRINGQLGGRPPKEDNPTKPSGLQINPDEPKKPDTVKDTVTVKVTDTVKDTVKEKEKKKTIPETSSGKKKVSIHFSPFKELFLKYYNQNSPTDYYWRVKDAQFINTLISQIKHAYKSVGNENPTEEEMNAGFEGILKKAQNDKWISQNFEPSIISSKFNNLKTDDTSSTKKAVQSVMEDILAGRR